MTKFYIAIAILIASNTIDSAYCFVPSSFQKAVLGKRGIDEFGRDKCSKDRLRFALDIRQQKKLSGGTEKGDDTHDMLIHEFANNLDNQMSYRMDLVSTFDPTVEQLTNELKTKEEEYSMSIRALQISQRTQEFILDRKITLLTQQLHDHITEANNTQARLTDEHNNRVEFLNAQIQKVQQALEESQEENRISEAMLGEITAERDQLLQEILEIKQLYQKESLHWEDQMEKEYNEISETKKKAISEINRLEEEVRIAFKLGRETSQRIQTELQQNLDDTAKALRLTKLSLAERDLYIDSIENDRKSFRKLAFTAWELAKSRTVDRLQYLRGSFSRIRGRKAKIEKQKNWEAKKESPKPETEKPKQSPRGDDDEQMLVF